MRITLSKIAKKTGVSVSAISQVLNNHPNAQTLRPETRERILQTVREMGYIRNENALQTRTGICKTVALISDFDTFFADNCTSQILSGILLAASEEGFSVKVYNRNCMESNFDEILRYGIKYLICFLFDKEIQKEVCEFCRRNELCLCYIQERPNREYPVIYSDDRAGVREVVSVLFHRGHRRFALINPPDDIIYAEQRKKGFLDGLDRAGIGGKEHRISCRASMRENRKDIEKMMRLPPEKRPTAFLCSDDQRTMHVESLAEKYGLKIPEDCVIVGFGDTISSNLPIPASTIRQPFKEMGRLALKTVIGKNPSPPEPENEFLLPTEFIERQTTKGRTA